VNQTLHIVEVVDDQGEVVKVKPAQGSLSPSNVRIYFKTRKLNEKSNAATHSQRRLRGRSSASERLSLQIYDNYNNPFVLNIN